jgi:hypothetical protein
VLVYRTLVLRRSPFASRPDRRYGLVWRGRFYEVWQQRAPAQRCTVARTRPVVVRLAGYTSRSRAFAVRRAGIYSLWVGGSFRKRLSAFVDRRFAGSLRGQLNNAGQYTELGRIALAAGGHDVELTYGSSPLTPGAGGVEYGLGPLVVSAASSC